MLEVEHSPTAISWLVVGLSWLVLIVIVIGLVKWFSRVDGRSALKAVAGTVGVLGLVILALGLVWVSAGDVAYQESVSVSAGDEHVSYSRAIRVDPAPTSTKKRRVELIPTPSDDPPVVEEPHEHESPLPASAPSWMNLAETSRPGDDPAVASDGPRPTESECRDRIRRQVANHIVYYARTQGMYPLGRRPQLIKDRLIEDVVRDEYVTTSPHTFGENEQTWYTLHQLLEYDDRVIAQLQALNERATGDEHVVALGVIGTGVLGLLGLTFVLLKVTEKKTPKPPPSTAWTVETTKRKKAKRKACGSTGKRWSSWC